MFLQNDEEKENKLSSESSKKTTAAAGILSPQWLLSTEVHDFSFFPI